MTTSEFIVIFVATATLINQWLIARYNKRPKQNPKMIEGDAKGDGLLRLGGILLGVSTLMAAALLISFAFEADTPPTRSDVLKITFGVVLGVVTVRDVMWLVMNPTKNV